MREITYSELETIVKVARNAKFHKQFVDFALKYYGEKSYKCEIYTNCEYNDSTYDDRITGITVLDKDGNILKVKENHPDVVKMYSDRVKGAETRKRNELALIRPSLSSSTIDETVKHYIKNNIRIESSVNDVLYDAYTKLDFPGKREDYYDDINEEEQKLVYIIGEPPSDKIPRIFIEE